MTTGKRPLRAEVFKGDDGKWYWRTIKNGRELSRSSQGYKHRLHGCIRALEVEQRLEYVPSMESLCRFELQKDVSTDDRIFLYDAVAIVPVTVVDQ